MNGSIVTSEVDSLEIPINRQFCMVTWVTRNIGVPLRYVPIQEVIQDWYQLTLLKAH